MAVKFASEFSIQINITRENDLVYHMFYTTKVEMFILFLIATYIL